jgi:uncharacterized membrane protein
MHYVPLAWPFFLAFWFLFAIMIALIEIGVLQYVFQTMGVSRRYMFGLLLFSLLGSYVNIPVARLSPEPLYGAHVIHYYGMEWVEPTIANSQGTIVAVNVGGAIIPTLLSVYLLFKHRLFLLAPIAVGIVTVIVHLMAHPVQGVGIAVPIFIPPLITALVALSLSRWRAAPLAYIAGSMGTLIGADLLNLNKIRGLGAPVASIGGAGKFDGIFLTGLVAVLIAGILGGGRRTSRQW